MSWRMREPELANGAILAQDASLVNAGRSARSEPTTFRAMSDEAIKTIAWSFVIVAALYPFEILFSANAENSLSRRLCNLAHMPLIVAFSYAIQPLAN